MENWEKDKQSTDKYLSFVCKILGFYLIGEPPLAEDQLRNSDLMTLTLGSMRTAVRIRGFEFYRYKNDFTIRSKRKSGLETEYTKIMKGWGDYLFYGWVNEDDTDLIEWHLLDLQYFRLGVLDMAKKGIEIERKYNDNGATEFMIFNYDMFPKELFFARSDERLRKQAS
jgi:hypothetical protein